MKTILLLAAVLIFPSCVTTAKYKRDLNAVADAAKAAVELARTKEKADCAAQSAEKDARLRQFNQLNADGTLR